MNSKTEKLTAILSLLGEEKAKALHQITGNERISMGAVTRLIKKTKVKESLKNSIPSPKLAKDLKVSLSTVYRANKK